VTREAEAGRRLRIRTVTGEPYGAARAALEERPGPEPTPVGRSATVRSFPSPSGRPPAVER